MSEFSIFQYLDPAIISDESMSFARASRSPAAWPSEASALRTDPSYFSLYGTCMRKAFLRMIAWAKMEEQAAAGPWKWIIGRAVEDKVTGLCALASLSKEVIDGHGDTQVIHESLYVANGVKHYIRDLYRSEERRVGKECRSR